MRRPLLAALLVVGTVAACSSSRGPVRVGALYPRSGAQGEQGREEAAGVALAAEWANEHGGVHGRRIQLVPVDVPRAESVPAAMGRLRAQGIRLVVGSHGSDFSAVAAEVATRKNMLFWETGAVGKTAPDVAGGRHFFRLAPMGSNLGRAAIDFMADEMSSRLNVGHPLRFAVANVDDAYGRAVSQGALDEVKTKGELVGRFAYPDRGADYDALALQIGAARPDVLFVAAYLDDGVALRRAMVTRGIHLAASIGTSSSYCHIAFGDRLGADAVGLFASDKPDAADVRSDALSPEGRRALAWVAPRYRAAHHQDMSAAALSGFSNAYALFAHVLPKAGSMTPAEVARAALAVKLPEGTLANGGGVDLAPPGAPDGGANRAASGVIWEWVALRTRAVVWPPAYANHPVTLLPLAGS